MIKYCVINADDFGRSIERNNAIDAAFSQGLVKSASLIVTTPYVYEAVSLAFNGGYVADTESRMFSEDFPWGLTVIRSYFDLFDVPAHTMDKVLRWYAAFVGQEWYDNGGFCGKDLRFTGAIQNYGYKTMDDIINLYGK